MILPAFRLVDETADKPVSKVERSLTPSRDVVEDAVGAIQQGTTPHRVNTCTRKRKGAEKGTDMAGEVA